MASRLDKGGEASLLVLSLQQIKKEELLRQSLSRYSKPELERLLKYLFDPSFVAEIEAKVPAPAQHSYLGIGRSTSRWRTHAAAVLPCMRCR